MSSWLYAVPLHAEGAYEWAASAEVTTHRLPAMAPPLRPLPQVREILAALRQAGCHGDIWYRVDGVDAALPQCPGGKCTADTHLGEVDLTADDRENKVLMPNTPIGSVGFRKPIGFAALRAVCALAAATGPWLAVDEDREAFVVAPDDTPDALAPVWPWQW